MNNFEGLTRIKANRFSEARLQELDTLVDTVRNEIHGGEYRLCIDETIRFVHDGWGPTADFDNAEHFHMHQPGKCALRWEMEYDDAGAKTGAFDIYAYGDVDALMNAIMMVKLAGGRLEPVAEEISV